MLAHSDHHPKGHKGEARKAGEANGNAQKTGTLFRELYFSLILTDPNSMAAAVMFMSQLHGIPSATPPFMATREPTFPEKLFKVKNVDDNEEHSPPLILLIALHLAARYTPSELWLLGGA
jgi:hypothetical protein